LEISSGLIQPTAYRDTVLVLAHDPAIIAAAQDAAHRLRRAPALVMGSGPEVLAHLAAPGDGPGHLVCDPAAAGASWPHLLATLSDPSARTGLVIVSASPGRSQGGRPTLPADSGRMAAAMLEAGQQPGRLPRDAAAALRAGLSNGEIVVRYQPVVRLQDRRPVMVEALARWHRAAAPISPAAFVPLAESAGLSRALSVIVASRAAADLAPLWQRLRLGVSVNLPLALLQEPDLPLWLARARRGTGLRAEQMALELTETTSVQDISALRRAMLRLREAGHRVLLDDLVLHDGRDRLLGLPFAGFKLDRSMVEALPAQGQVRREVRRLVRHAEKRGQTVIAEGVSDARLWSTVRALGVHAAQGFLVGRPLPVAALPAWWAGWRGGGPG
jgi:EAL domain-containing protein (putative c-di-GMP-specific phosphodiesterase class I)